MQSIPNEYFRLFFFLVFLEEIHDIKFDFQIKKFLERLQTNLKKKKKKTLRRSDEISRKIFQRS